MYFDLNGYSVYNFILETTLCSITNGTTEKYLFTFPFELNDWKVYIKYIVWTANLLQVSLLAKVIFFCWVHEATFIWHSLS